MAGTEATSGLGPIVQAVFLLEILGAKKELVECFSTVGYVLAINGIGRRTHGFEPEIERHPVRVASLRSKVPTAAPVS